MKFVLNPDGIVQFLHLKLILPLDGVVQFIFNPEGVVQCAIPLDAVVQFQYLKLALPLIGVVQFHLKHSIPPD